MKAARERTIGQAHWNEALAREKRLKPIDHYFKPPAKPGADHARVAAGLRAAEQSGLAVTVKRIKRKD